MPTESRAWQQSCAEHETKIRMQKKPVIRKIYWKYFPWQHVTCTKISGTIQITEASVPWEQQTLLWTFLPAPFHFLPWNGFLKKLSLFLSLSTCPKLTFVGEKNLEISVGTYKTLWSAYSTCLESMFNFTCLNPERDPGKAISTLNKQGKQGYGIQALWSWVELFSSFILNFTV